MNASQFIQMVHQECYPEPIEVRQAPNGFLNDHTHSFAVKALVIEGSIQIVTQGNCKTYLAGDVFQLDFEQLHAESYGPAGVIYLASRKQ